VCIASVQNGLKQWFTALKAVDYFNVSVCTATRGHPYKLFLTRCFTDVRKYFFCNRFVKIWNELPSDTDFTCVNCF